MTHTAEIEATTLAAAPLDSSAVPQPIAIPAESMSPTPRRPRTMGRRVRYSFDINLTPAELEKDLSYGRD